MSQEINSASVKALRDAVSSLLQVGQGATQNNFDEFIKDDGEKVVKPSRNYGDGVTFIATFDNDKDKKILTVKHVSTLLEENNILEKNQYEIKIDEKTGGGMVILKSNLTDEQIKNAHECTDRCNKGGGNFDKSFTETLLKERDRTSNRIEIT